MGFLFVLVFFFSPALDTWDQKLISDDLLTKCWMVTIFDLANGAGSSCISPAISSAVTLEHSSPRLFPLCFTSNKYGLTSGGVVENEFRNTIPFLHDKFPSTPVNADSIFMINKNLRSKVKFSFIIPMRKKKITTYSYISSINIFFYYFC